MQPNAFHTHTNWLVCVCGVGGGGQMSKSDWSDLLSNFLYTCISEFDGFVICQCWWRFWRSILMFIFFRFNSLACTWHAAFHTGGHSLCSPSFGQGQGETYPICAQFEFDQHVMLWKTYSGVVLSFMLHQWGYWWLMTKTKTQKISSVEEQTITIHWSEKMFV